MVVRACFAAADLFLCALRLREHHGTRDCDVHAVSDRDTRGWSAAIPAVLSLAYFSNLAAALTHYGTTPAPIYFGAGYTTQRTWWTVGLITSLITISVWSLVGFTWWKVLRLW